MNLDDQEQYIIETLKRKCEHVKTSLYSFLKKANESFELYYIIEILEKFFNDKGWIFAFTNANNVVTFVMDAFNSYIKLYLYYDKYFIIKDIGLDMLDSCEFPLSKFDAENLPIIIDFDLVDKMKSEVSANQSVELLEIFLKCYSPNPNYQPKLVCNFDKSIKHFDMSPINTFLSKASKEQQSKCVTPEQFITEHLNRFIDLYLHY